MAAMEVVGVKKIANKKRFVVQDIDKLAEILKLVEEENYTIAGAKQQIKLRKQGLSNKEQVIQRLEGVKAILIKLHGSYE